MRARIATAAGLAVLAGALAIAIVGFVKWGVKCGDDCGASGSWRHDDSPWPWALQAALGGAGVAIAAGLLQAISLGNRVGAALTLIAVAGVDAAWAALVDAGALVTVAALVVPAAAGALVLPAIEPPEAEPSG